MGTVHFSQTIILLLPEFTASHFLQ